jgi:hypothetical protein
MIRAIMVLIALLGEEVTGHTFKFMAAISLAPQETGPTRLQVLFSATSSVCM